LLKMSLSQYINARDGLLKKDLIAFDGTIYQVLSLPVKSIPVRAKKPPSRKTGQAESVGKVLNKLLMETSHG
jgi:hypothetical protein